MTSAGSDGPDERGQKVLGGTTAARRENELGSRLLGERRTVIPYRRPSVSCQHVHGIAMHQQQCSHDDRAGKRLAAIDKRRLGR